MKYLKPSILVLIAITFLTGETVFTCNFNDESVGTYTPEKMKAAWNNPSWENGLSEGRGEIVSEDGSNCLQILYPKDSVGDGAKWEMDLGMKYDTLWVSYRLKFHDNFEFVRGGKLPGLGGGTTPTGGQVTTGTEGFSARIMWRLKNTGDGEQGAICQYVYHMDMPGTYGEDLYWAYPNYSWSSTRRYFVPGQWHTVKTRIIINTPGEFDGRITSWLDGELGLDSTMRFRAEGITNFAVDKFLFSTFFGGSDSTWAPVKDEYIYFDDFIISTTDPDGEPVPVNRNTHNSLKENISVTKKGKSYSLIVSDPQMGNLTVTDIKGREIATVFPTVTASQLEYQWSCTSVAPGIYYLHFKGKDEEQSYSVIVQ